MQDRDTILRWGRVSRLDTIQAAVLRYRLTRLPGIVARRRANVEAYRRFLDPQLVFVPAERSHEFIAPHTLVVQVDRRDGLRAHLADHGVTTAVHYPVPLHLQPTAALLGYKAGDFPACERQSRRILTLPIHPGLDEDDVRFVASRINEFLARPSGSSSSS
jgi:dTDP-4-amino-4,6-dideoxygalactose transaminase